MSTSWSVFIGMAFGLALGTFVALLCLQRRVVRLEVMLGINKGRRSFISGGYGP